jgi:hypothetical protein
MNKVKRLEIGPVAFLVLLALLTLLVVIRKDHTAEEAEDDAARAAVKLEDKIDRDAAAVSGRSV